MAEVPKVLAAWARKTDEAEKVWAREAVDSWARVAPFSQPLNWGEAEAAVLDRDYPPLPGMFALKLVGLVGVGFLALLAAPFYGAALIGLVLVALAPAQSTGAEGLLWLARLAFGLAIIMAGLELSTWWGTRRRSAYGVATAAVTAIGAGAAYVLVLILDLPEMAWLAALALVAAILGTARLVLELVSKPEGGAKNRKPPPRGPRGSSQRLRASKARDRLLEILIQRRLVTVDEGDKIRLREMPLGYWSELDGLDEREWRRVLEYRHVGWREFDASDEQVR
ncbi:LigA [Nocardioidaceae bacterium Broad-1]|uniref:hypothetical protein n=1 Tax=Nocardioides luteus TaxID=1844 RepID=UPI0002028443|nr:hypothetical protein [Nocardioides luteus]EGD44833.1 LigA [Nocardioidaceae bacterium Broad-1]MBG6098968.1 hypothetical protein [Nocardioides luteus]